MREHNPEQECRQNSNAISASAPLSSSNKIDKMTQRPRASVRFPNDEEIEQVQYIPNLDELSFFEKRKLWYSTIDYTKFKKMNKKISKTTVNCGYSVLLNNSYGLTRRDEKNIDDDNISPNHFFEDAQNDLNSWCRFGHSRRGLELSSNANHRKERNMDVCRSTAIVLHVQNFIKRKLRLKNQNIDGATSVGSIENGEEYSDWEEQVAKAYKLTAENARQFAIMMGKADEYAVLATMQNTPESLPSWCDKIELEEDNDDDCSLSDSSYEEENQYEKRKPALYKPAKMKISRSTVYPEALAA